MSRVFYMETKMANIIRTAAAVPRPNSVNPIDRRGVLRQPAWVAQLDDALLKLPFVEALTGLAASSLYRKIAEGQFPAPIRLGTRCSRWRVADINHWLRQQAESAQ